MQPVERPAQQGPTICLNMIVRNEAHIVHEVLNAVAPYINSWLIVDTGSDDGSQDAIRNHLASMGIPGELHQRQWRNFAHNRTEALTLAQGQADYIWVMDADDTLVGTPDFSRLDSDIYMLNIEEGQGNNVLRYRRPLLFHNGLRVRYEGALHEIAVWDEPYVVTHLDGDYHVECRHLGARSQDPHKHARDCEVLLAEIERNPEDARSVFYLAQTYFALGDFANARRWYARRVEMGGFMEEVYYSMFRIAQSASELGERWEDVQDAYLRAWEYRPQRADPTGGDRRGAGDGRHHAHRAPHSDTR